MADNFSFDEGADKTGAADEIGGVLYPRVKVVHGADGSATDVSTASPMPAQLRDSDGTDVGMSAKLGSLTETAPATDTASSGLNGRLQRIAQRLTSLIALVPAALTGSGNFKVAVNEWVAGVVAAVTGTVADQDADSGNPVKVGGKYNATKPTYTDGDRADLQLGARGSLIVEINTAGGTSGITSSADNADAVAATATANSLRIANSNRVFNGSTWDRMRGDTEGTHMVGNEAHDAADAGNPIKVGYKAIAHGSNPTAVAANDRTDGYANRHGIPWVIGGHPNVISTAVTVADADGAQTDAAIVTVSAGTKIVVTRITVMCSNANTGDVSVKVGFAAANLGSPSTTAAAGILLDAKAIDGGSGVTIGDGSGILGIGADGEDLRYTCDDPAGGHVSITVSYYTIES